MASKSEALQAIQERYDLILQQKTDQPHLPILKKYGEECDTIVEVGFRGGISASAFLASKPKTFITIDWNKAPFQVNQLMIKTMQQECEAIGSQFIFVEADILEAYVPQCDLLFLDGFHTYEHVLLELIKHESAAQKFILLHDTDEPSCPGMFPAVEDFLLDNLRWDLEERYQERPGLTVLRRKDPELYFHPQYDPPNYPKVLIRTLEHEVNRQKQMYYDQMYGTEPSKWDHYIAEEQIRYSDAERWPLTNKKIGATEMMAAYQVHQKES